MSVHNHPLPVPANAFSALRSTHPTTLRPTPPLSPFQRSWLDKVVKEPLASLEPPPAAMRRRPLIYIYDLEPMYSTRMLQYRWVLTLGGAGGARKGRG